MSGTRAFIAIDIDGSLWKPISTVSAELAALGCTVSTSKSNLHITLFFFESISDSEIKLIEAAMRIAKCNEFLLTLKGVDFFMHKNDPLVAYIGIKHSIPLLSLYRTLNEALSVAGVATEKKPFSPHLTVGRVRRGSNPVKREALIAMRSKYAASEFGSFICRSMVLKRRVLSEHGPVYSDIYKIDFSKMSAKPKT
jgi:2'-5' RNA ligase